MITFENEKKLIKNVYNYNQEHIFEYWDEITEKQKKNLIEELSEVDFDLIVKLYNQKDNISKSEIGFIPTPYIPAQESNNDKNDYIKAKLAGSEYISSGKMAALLVAGGQGARLGFDGPKGMFPVGAISNKSLFQIHAEKILMSSNKYKVTIPWLIMTSKTNNDETVKYFEDNNHFGLKKNNVKFFSQKMIPSLDLNGKLILKNKYSLFMNPDGHGGTLTALFTSGLLHELMEKGIEAISYFQVDNPLVNIIDPVFTGFHILNSSDVSSKAVMKALPEEKVGVFVKLDNGKTGVIEYSDFPEEKQNAIDDNGKLLFCMGSIAIHIFKTSYIDSITSGKHLSFPYHLAKKKIKAFTKGNETEIDGFKYEKFIFDALTLTKKNTILETKREDEFAPVKNASGVDSVETARELMNNLCHRWLSNREISIPSITKTIEISPLLAVDPEDINQNISIPDQESVYLE